MTLFILSVGLNLRYQACLQGHGRESDKFKFGSPHAWAMSEELRENDAVNFDDDPLLGSFKLDL